MCSIWVNGQINCPSLIGFNTCGCSDTGDRTIYLDCGGAQLGDLKASQLLQLFINNSNVSPLASLYLAYNQLSKIQDEIAQLNQLETAYFHGNNINTIKANAFNFTPTLKMLYLASIAISSIEAGAFNGKLWYLIIVIESSDQ